MIRLWAGVLRRSRWMLYSAFLLHWTGMAAAQTADAPKKIDWNGTFGMRWQGDLQSKRRAQNIFQVALTIDATVKASDQLDFGTRLITGDVREIATAGWVNIGNFQDRKGFTLSRVYARYRPVPAVTLFLGKIASPFVRPTETVFDNDISFEGLAQQLTLNNKNRTASLSLNLAEVMINQRASGTLDISRTFLIGGQVTAQFTRPSDAGSLAAGVYGFGNADSIYSAQNLKNPVLLLVANTNRPNATKTGFKSEFRLINIGGQWNHKFGAWPLDVAVDYAINTGAANERQAISGMVTLGSTRNVGGTRVGVQGFHVGSDAALAAFSNIDYTQTNSNGVGFLFGHQPAKNLTLEIAVYTRKFDKPGSLITPTALNSYRTRARFAVMARF